MNSEEKRALFLLSGIENISSLRLRLMYDHFGSFLEASKASEEEMIRAGIIDPLKDRNYRGYYGKRISDEKYTDGMKRRFDAMEKNGIRMITFDEPEMPGRFNILEDPPVCLYVKGKLPDDRVPSVSIIGSRLCSEYGRSIAEFFAGELAKAGIQIISGMAYGIDSAAAYGALQAGCDSFAVLGSGPDICYPAESRSVYEKMCAGQGGILSEYAPGTQAISWHFIHRNRLIAGLGDTLAVIEAKVKSGTSITVNDALSQGKDIFALPGRITDPLGMGCNQLIKDGAMVITCPDDIISYLGAGKKTGKQIAASDPEGLSPLEKRILEVMGPDSLHTEDIAELAKTSVEEAMRALSLLEIKKAVRSTGHARFVKIYK